MNDVKRWAQRRLRNQPQITLRGCGEAGVIHGREEGVDDVGIELGTGATLNFKQGFIDGAAHAIGAVRCERVERIGNGDETRSQRNLGTLEIPRVSISIETFVMVEKQQGSIVKTLDVADGHPSPLGMHADPGELFIGEFAGFQQNVVRHPDLPDIVKRRRQDHIFGFVFRHAHLDRDPANIVRNSRTVSTGVTVPQVNERNQRAGHGQCLLAVTVFELGDSVVCVDCRHCFRHHGSFDRQPRCYQLLSASVQSKNRAGTIEFTAITLFALGLYLPFRAIQYDTNGIDEAQLVEAGPLFHKNHMLYRPLASVLYGAAKAAGYSGNSLTVLQVMNAFFGAIGIGLCYLIFRYVVKDRTAAMAGSIWLATSFTYWYFSTDAGYIMLAGMFALAAMAAAVYGWALSAALFTALSIFTWQAGIFLVPAISTLTRLFGPPLPLGEAAAKRRVRVAVVTILLVGVVYIVAGFSRGHYTPRALLTWVSSYGDSGTSLPRWGAWGWDRLQASSVSALRSMTPVLLAARPSDFARHVQLGRIAVDFSLIALAMLFLLAALKARRIAFYFLAGYALFLPFIVWWDPYDPKWFLIPNIFLAGFLTCGLMPWLQGKYARMVVLGCVLAIAGTNFVTTILPRHSQLGPDRTMAQCVAEKMTEADLFVSAEWGWPEYLSYLHGRPSISVINESIPAVVERIRSTQTMGGSVYMFDPHHYSGNHIQWLKDQTGVTIEELLKFGGAPSFTCYGATLLRIRP